MSYEVGIFICLIFSLIIQLVLLIVYLSKENNECKCNSSSTFANRYKRGRYYSKQGPPATTQYESNLPTKVLSDPIEYKLINVKYLTKDEIINYWNKTRCPYQLSTNTINTLLNQPDFKAYKSMDAAKNQYELCGKNQTTISYSPDQIDELKSLWLKYTGQNDLSIEVKETIKQSEQLNIPYEKFKKNKFQQLLETENFRNKGFY